MLCFWIGYVGFGFTIVFSDLLFCLWICGYNFVNMFCTYRPTLQNSMKIVKETFGGRARTQIISYAVLNANIPNTTQWIKSQEWRKKKTAHQNTITADNDQLSNIIKYTTDSIKCEKYKLSRFWKNKRHFIEPLWYSYRHPLMGQLLMIQL